jgi:hypothetical protein
MFFSCILVFLFSTLTPLRYLIVYAAVISCGRAGPSLDTCDGTERYDNMEGDPDRNSIHGFGGDDLLSGSLDNDALHGGSGNDKLTGGLGDDILFGSPGEDSFDCGLGNDQIIHFNLSEADTKSNDCESIWP